MRQCITLLILLICQHAGAQEPAAAPPILVLDSGGHTANVRKVLFTPHGHEVISVSWDKTIRIWDVASGEPLRVLRPPVGLGQEGRLWDAALSPDGQFLAVGGWGIGEGMGWIYVMSMRTGRIEQVLKGHTNIVNCLAFARRPDGRSILASGGWDRTARLWDLATGQCVRILRDHGESVRGVAFAPDGSRLVTASYDKKARIWSVADGRCESVLGEHTEGLLCVAWSPDGETLATGGFDRSIRLWRPDGKLLRRFSDRESLVSSIVFASNSKELLYTWGGDGKAKGGAMLDIVSGRERVRFAKHDSNVFCGALSPDGTLAATAGGQVHEIYLWKTSDATPVQRLVGKGKPVYSAGWSPDGETIAWGNTRTGESPNNKGPLESTFRLSDLERREAPDVGYRRAQETRGSLSLVASGVTSVDIKTGNAVVARLETGYERDKISCFSLVRGDRAAIGTTLGYFFLCETRSGELIRDFESHADSLCAVAPSPDGRFLLTASSDQTIRIWDPERGLPLLYLFFAGEDWIAWTPEGYYAASPGGERLMGWQVSNGPEQVGTFVPASQFHKSLYRPDVIKLLLSTGSVGRALEVLHERRKTVETVRDVLPPVVVITNPDRSGVRLDIPELEIRAVAKAQPGQPVTALRLIVDGRPFEGEQGRKLVSKEQSAERQVRDSWKLRLGAGKHRLTVIAESAVSNGRSDEIEVLYEEKRAEPPRLYIVAIGVSRYPGRLRLQYAADDARAVESVFRAKSGPLFESIEARAVVDEDATRRSIIGKLNWLRQTMRDQDVGLFFFSGHGDLRDGTFYLISVDADVNDLESTAVPAAQLKSILATTKGKLVVLLDACHSGAQAAMLPPRIPIRRVEWSQPIIPVERLRSPESLLTKFRLLGLQQEGEKQLRPSTDELVRALSNDEHGVITMSSSTGREVSIESAALKHGYFTEALTEGLSGKADMNNDGLVYLTELDAYLVNRVTDLSSDRQHPTTAKPPGVRSFPLSRSRP